jgi:hypothetical protein
MIRGDLKHGMAVGLAEVADGSFEDGIIASDLERLSRIEALGSFG